jgi:hypothetical protein
MYYLLPMSEEAIAVIFFLIASAGLYTIHADINNFILIGLASLVGMFGTQAAKKLKKIAEGLLTTAH